MRLAIQVMRGAGVLLALVPATAGADALQEQLLARMRATDTTDVGFVQTTRAEQTGSDARTTVLRYDPRAPAASRWSVTSVDGRPATDKQRSGALKMAAGSPLPSYTRLAKWFGAPATRIAQGRTPQGQGGVTYRFAGLPAGTIKMGSHDASADTVVEAFVNTAGAQPYVERVRFTSSVGFRMMLVAKVERFVFTASYAPLADGRVFPTGSDGDIAGSMMGKSGSIATRTRFVAQR